MDCMLVMMGRTGHNGWMDGEYGEELGGVWAELKGSFCLGTMGDELFFLFFFFFAWGL
jgi:hypothetical protein